MPVYEYRCLTCGKEFEYQQRMADPAKTVCEACGGELERLISRTAFQLKGGGWYKDLYASTRPEAAAKAGEGGDGATKVDPKPDAKTTESKPDAKTESKPAATTTESKPATTSGGSGTGTGTGTGGGTGA
jgi:putative FmdB family regulatory protein